MISSEQVNPEDIGPPFDLHPVEHSQHELARIHADAVRPQGEKRLSVENVFDRRRSPSLVARHFRLQQPAGTP